MVPVKSVLIASSDKTASEKVENSLDDSFRTDLVASFEDCISLFKKRRYDLLFIDSSLLIKNGDHGTVKKFEQILEPFYKIFPTAEIIIMAPPEKIRDAVYFVKAGASDYLTFPVSPSEITFIVERIYERTQEKHELNYLRDQVFDQGEVVLKKTDSSLMREVHAKIVSVAKTKTTVLLSGESGTGKTMIAGIIHNQSIRNDRQFISVHCGAIPDALIESELFGHEKGAFTGAIKRKMGKFELANNGTIFLDEIGTITHSVQIKLLKVLQDKVFQRIGGEADIQSDIRIIAATNANLADMVKKGDYRNDLYYRLNVFPIEIPPLRERIDEVEELTHTFLNNLNIQYQKEIESIHPLVLDGLKHYNWPGNIRELENLVERAYILETSGCLTPESFPAELFEDDNFSTILHVPLTAGLTISDVRKQAVEDVERQYLKDILTINNGRINRSSETAGITPRQLHKLMKKYDIDKNDFKNSSY